jgi:23S rRNA pseudouridine1911/1915/1917 synthase
MVHPDGKDSLTKVRVLKRFERRTTNGERFSLVECRPETGRMHQIRAHLQHAGHSIVGDKLYGPDERCYLELIETGWNPALAEKLLLDRQALHAGCLEWRDCRWECALPATLAEFAGLPRESAEVNQPS